jgi:hypothetical protein
MLSHQFAYPRVVPIPTRTADDQRTPQGLPPNRQRDLVMASLIRCPAGASSRGRLQA